MRSYNHRVLVASPAYLAERGVPATPGELRHHTALSFVIRDEVQRSWKLRIDDEWQSVAIDGPYVTDGGEIVKRWALSGLGIAYKSWLDVADAVAAGRLVRVRPQWRGEDAPLQFIAPGRQQLTEAARRLHGFLAERLAVYAAPSPA